MTHSQTNSKLAAKGLNKRTLEDSGDGPMSEFRDGLEDVVNVKSANRDFRTIQHAVATYGQTKEGLSNFYPKKSSAWWITHSFP